MENMLIYKSNVAYRVLKDTDQVNLISDESASKEIKREPTYVEIISTDQHPSSRENSQRFTDDNLKADLTKMKKILIVMLLLC